jgi:hypothetical protein
VLTKKKGKQYRGTAKRNFPIRENSTAVPKARVLAHKYFKKYMNMKKRRGTTSCTD